MVAYCGRECQEEHYGKVHKQYCKYLGGIKKAKHSEHDRDACKTCIASNSVGDLVFSPTNSNYVCIFKYTDLKLLKLLPTTYPHPFPLTGSPEDRIEKMLTAAVRVLLKIKVTENPVYLLQRLQVDELEKCLWDLKGKLYLNRMCGDNRNPMKVMSFQEFLIDPFGPWKLIADNLSYCDYPTPGDDYKLLATLALLRDLILATNNLNIESSFKSPNSLPKEYRQVSRKDQFFEVADKIMEALEQEVVPFKDLAEIACGDKTAASVTRRSSFKASPWTNSR